MLKKSVTIAAFLVSIGIGFMLSGMLTSSIIKVCKILNRNQPSLFQKARENEKTEEEQTLCVEQGLFMLKISMQKGAFYLPISLEGQKVIARAAAGLLLLGSIGSALSALFFTLSACYADSSNEKPVFITVKRNLIATMIQLLNVILLVSGMSIYTSQKMKTIENPEEFADQVQHVLSGVEGIFNQNLQTLSPLSRPPQSIAERAPHPMLRDFAAENAQRNMLRNFLNISTENEQNNDEINTHNEDSGYSSHVSSYVSLQQSFESSNVTSHESEPLLKRSRRNIRRFGLLRSRLQSRGPSIFRQNIFDTIKNAKPVLSYSFYFLWIGCVFHGLALISGIANCKRTFSTRNQLPNPS